MCNRDGHGSRVWLYFLGLDLIFWEKAESGFGMNGMVYNVYTMYVKAWQR